MPIRITGMYSGLDTEAIISELVSAQSVKKSKYVKEQTKLSWKMDAWKALNTKIYNFYTNTLDNMRFQSAYMKKATKVSNTNALSVIAGNNAPDGVQSVSVDQLAKTGKLTGRDLSLDGKNVTADTKLSELGVSADASFKINVGGKTTTIKLNGDMKISDVVQKLKDAGISASFDETNHRFFLSSTETGAKGDFTITADNEQGLAALKALGLASKDDATKAEYEKWASYLDPQNADAYDKVIAEEMAKRAAALKAQNDSLTAQNESLQKEIDELKGSESYKQAEQKGETALHNELYGADDASGLKKDLDDAKAKLEELKQKLADGEPDVSQDDVDAAQKTVDEKQSSFNDLELQYNTLSEVKSKQAQFDANQKTIDDNNTLYTTGADASGNATIEGTETLKQQVKADFDAKATYAKQALQELAAGGDDGYGAVKVNGQDAKITLDGAEFTSSTNDFNINGMNITVYETTDTPATITTSADVDGIYDMVKNFFKEYNSLMNEMSALYNADSSKGYEPLTSEEKAEMADSEIEEWEKKIKDSLLRRDSTLGDLTDSIKTVMMQGATVNGKTMYLSDFGINTLGYFNAAENEKNAYHINGDADDASVKGEADTLKMMLATDPETVGNFFSGLANNLYNKLTDKMSAIKNTRSVFTVYNDKTMKAEYDDYKDKIAKEEDKLNALMDKWYTKFSQMETAMAKLQSKSGSISSMFGGS